jgi:hypothetical protein
MTAKFYMHPTTNRHYFKLYHGKVLIGTYGFNFGWPSRDDAMSAAADAIYQLESAA